MKNIVMDFVKETGLTLQEVSPWDKTTHLEISGASLRKIFDKVSKYNSRHKGKVRVSVRNEESKDATYLKFFLLEEGNQE